MSPTRRRVLSAVGVGIASTAFVRPGRAVAVAPSGDAERVFVHPERSLVGSLTDVVGRIGGEVLYEYANFPFVAAAVPGDAVDDLANAAGVALVERDRPVELEHPVGGVLDGVDLDDGIDIGLGDGDDRDGGDDATCAGHPPQDPSWGYERIGADDAQGAGTGVDVAVLDTGIDSSHCDLSVAGGRNVTDSGDPDDYEDRNGHGTHCAGIACALDDDAGVVGVAPGANLYAVKVLDDDGNGYQSWMAAGIDWCLEHGIELVSMSLGSESGTVAMDAAIEEATAQGHLLIGSAGNRGNDGSCDEENVTYPATHDDVLAVAATDRDDSLASYSSVGSTVDLLAPGSRIRSTTVDNEYAVESGTSMAAPHVTGTAALVWERTGAPGPGNASEQVRRTLLETAESGLETCAEGDGLVDAAAATAVDSDSDSGSDSGDADDSDRNSRSGGGGTDGSGRSDGAGGGTGVDEVSRQAESLWTRGIAALESLFEALAGLLGR